MRRPLVLLALLAVAAPAPAQESTVRGTVTTSDRRPLAGVNVFLLETLEGATTGPDGAFSFETDRTGPATLVFLRYDLAEERRSLDLPRGEPVDAALVEVIRLDAISVRAGGYTASDDPGASLTSLDVVTTPGAGASIGGAIRALPGVQAVDDGTGFFVRGGDQGETRFFLNEAGVLVALRPEEPTGSTAPQIDPFLLDGIFFSSGAFGARYGDALSAVVALETKGRPESFRPQVGLHMAGVEAGIQGPLGGSAGGAVTLSRLDIGPIHAVNGTSRHYSRTPQGWEASGSLAAGYGGAGEVKAFAIGQTFDMAVEEEGPSFADAHVVDRESGAAIVIWRDRWRRLAPVVSASRSTSRSRESSGAYRLRDDRSSTQLFMSLAAEAGPAFLVTAGAELDAVVAEWAGTFPADAASRGDGAAVVPLDDRERAERTGAFMEAEWAPTARTALRAGLRTDRSTLSRARTWDPRLSVTWRHPRGISLLLGGGLYHQVPDPLLFARSETRLAPMRAVQMVAGVEAGRGDDRLLRVETYWKRYDDLAQVTRNHRAVGGGEGRSVGLDAFAKGAGPWGTRGWISYSLVDADRTDPDSGERARAPFDVTHGLTVVLGKSPAPGWSVRGAWRYATGRPFTDVVGAAFDSARGIWVPEYGAPFEDRLPANHRLDLSVSRLVRFGTDNLAVFYASLGDAYDRGGVLEYTWTDDYSRRIAVPSRSRRSVFAGVSIEF